MNDDGFITSECLLTCFQQGEEISHWILIVGGPISNFYLTKNIIFLNKIHYATVTCKRYNLQ
ncbi:hypothetical protein XarbCFBP7408_18800 [Xanthomonas arboricola pv. guizotiae]|nr:hypothetical protein XarbCFBP7408_18800 [Xanthomonas arboricola pv. guizotiae]